MRTLATPFCSATNEDLEAVSGLPWLYDINLQKNNITYSALPIFKKMYGLNLRRANLLSSSMPQQDYDRLKQDVPGIEFQFTSKLLPP